MKLFAISDVHVAYPDNRRAVESAPAHPDDWLILGGDVCETEDDLDFTLSSLNRKFARLLWVPGNHELWTIPNRETARGKAKYQRMVDLCRRHNVLTPEDPYVIWPGDGGPHLLAPLFVLYDYSFRPDYVPLDRALDWARESEIECADEQLLHADPYPSKAAWCSARCDTTESRLAEAMTRHACPFVLINHFPLRQELAVLPMVPRFSIWCGTRRTETWHTRFRAAAVIFGHLHIRQSRVIDGVRFEEVSFGYPRQWDRRPDKTFNGHLKQILPAPSRPL